MEGHVKTMKKIKNIQITEVPNREEMKKEATDLPCIFLAKIIQPIARDGYSLIF